MVRLSALLAASLALAVAAPAQAEVYSIGDTSSTWTMSSYYRGNVVLADEDVTVEWFEVYLGLGAACTLDFFIHEGPSETGPWTVVWYGSVWEPAGTGFHGSGTVNEPLNAGSYYAFGVGWNCSAAYYGQSTPGLAGTDVGVGGFIRNVWSNSYAFSAAFVPPSAGSEALAYYQSYSVTAGEVDADADGWSRLDGDCDDGDASVYPGAAEVCNGVDDNCNGAIDDGLALSTYYRDDDLDDFGTDLAAVTACVAPPGYTSAGGDCDDGDPAVYPGAVEICDGADDDCDGAVDEGLSVTVYADADGDGYGNPPSAHEDCEVPAGSVDMGGDCNDTVADINPGAVEVCDDVDNNCNGAVDEDLAVTAYYLDLDGDGYGAPASVVESCDWPAGRIDVGGDCDDALAAVNPGAVEVVGDGVDNDCDGVIDEGPEPDADADADADADVDADTDGDVDADGDGDADGGDEVIVVQGCACRAAGGGSIVAALVSLLAP